MTTVRMHPTAARAFAAALTASARSLDHRRADLVGPYLQATTLLDQPGEFGGRLHTAHRVALELDRMATDLSWRAALVETADGQVDQLGRLTTELPDRRLDHVLLTTAQLATRIERGDQGARLAALEEAAVRAMADSAVAAEIVLALGPDTMVEIIASYRTSWWRDAEPPMALGDLLVAAVATGDQAAITVVSQTTTGLHFRVQDQMLDTVVRSFAEVDVAGHGDEADGTVSVDDLLVASQGSGDLAEAATWLLMNGQMLRWLSMGDDNDRYVHPGDEPDLPLRPPRFGAADIEHYRIRRDAAFTLLPLLGAIDTAAQADSDRADGFRSRADFEATLSWESLTDHQRVAVQQVLADGAYDTASHSEDALTVAGLLPVVGDGVDGLAAVYFVVEGDYGRAAQHAIGVVPLPGFHGSGTRLVREFSAGQIGTTRLTVGLLDDTALNTLDWETKGGARELLGRLDDSGVRSGD